MSLMDGMVLDCYDREKLAGDSISLAWKFAHKYAMPAVPFREEDEIFSLCLISIARCIWTWMPDVVPWKTYLWQAMKYDFLQETLYRGCWSRKKILWCKGNDGQKHAIDFARSCESDPSEIVETREHFENLISEFGHIRQHLLREVIWKRVPIGIAAAKMRITDRTAECYLREFRILLGRNLSTRQHGRERTKSLKTLRGPCILTWEQVRQIRSRYAAGKTRQELATEFGVASSTVRRIVLNIIWKNDPFAPRCRIRRNAAAAAA